MALDQTCRQYVGRLLRVVPVYGWGWWEFDAAGPVPYTQAQSEGPPAFFLRVEYFYTYAGVLQGAVGRVETEGHVYDGLFAVFYLRHLSGEQPTNFTDNIGQYYIQMGPDMPYLGEHPPGEDNDWPVWVFTGRPYIGGYASIGGNGYAVPNA